MKAKEELNALKNEVEVLNQKLSTLTDEELEQVTGGVDPGLDIEQPVIEVHRIGGPTLVGKLPALK